MLRLSPVDHASNLLPIPINSLLHHVSWVLVFKGARFHTVGSPWLWFLASKGAYVDDGLSQRRHTLLKYSHITPLFYCGVTGSKLPLMQELIPSGINEFLDVVIFYAVFKCPNFPLEVWIHN